MPPLVIITDLDHPGVAEEEAELAPVGARLLVAQCRTEQDVLASCREADGLIVQYAPITAAVFTGLPRLRVVARYGVGVDTLDVAAATARGVIVANVPGFCTEEVASHALAFLLAWHRKVVRFERAVKAGRWDFALAGPTPRLRGQVLGIVGVGRIGSALARMAAPLGLTTWGHDPYRSEFPPSVRRVPLDELAAGADYLSVSCPLTAETRHLINAAVLRRMKPTAFLINTARGAVVEEEALVRALKEGWIAGAGLDVLEREPPAPDTPLLGMENVLLTPHAAFYSLGSLSEVKRRAAAAVAAVLRGERPESVVNPEVYTRAR